MRQIALLLTCSLWLFATRPALAQDETDKAVYQVGVASVDITPSYPIRLNGFGNRREQSEGVSQRIFAKSLAIAQEGGSPLVLVALDSLGIRSEMVETVARRLSESHRLPPENLAVTFTHSHCTPKVNGACDNIFSSPIPADHQRHIDRYTKELTDKITQSAQQALDSMEPAHLQWAVGKVGFAKNRRTVGGPVDHDLPVLVVRAPESGKPRAIYVAYACHCVTLSFNQISGDWAGYAAEMIERRFPGATGIVSIGAGSDQNPISGVMGGQVEVAKGQGIQIADEVKRLLSGPLRDIHGKPTSVKRRIPLPLNAPPTREQLIAQTTKGRPTDKYNARTQLARLDRGEALQRQIDYTVQTWTFGDSLCMTFLAGEVCVDYSLRLKAAIDRNRYWLNAYSNDFCSYIPSERLVKEGGYGGGSETPYFALPTTLQAGLEQKIVDEVLRQTPASFLAPKGTLGISPKPPQDSLHAIRTVGGWKAELAASEPQVRDPVAIDFGADGRLWVAEMKEYGRDVYERFPQHSRVRWLRDADGDGHFETAQTFVENLRFPTDVKVWRDGVLICDAPKILWARDTDDDGRADEVETLYSGFEIRNAQARVNSLRWGLDGWLYGAGGLFGGKIKSHQTGEVVDCSNRDFRIRPDAGLVEAVAGRTQQGRDRNDWGDWFGCSNGALLRTIARPSDGSAAPRLSLDDGAARLFPPDGLVRFALSGAPGKATSACGLGIYRDGRLGEAMQGDAFTCEPVHQLVHRIDLSRQGHGFSGKRAVGEESREFLHSTDRWFRPVQVRTGPDGALWVVDMYRFVIEHPRWIPQATLAELDVFAGRDRGRIYRIVPDQLQATELGQRIPDMQPLSNQQLAAQLGSPNGVVRDLAQQLLQWRDAEKANVVQEIRQVARTSEYPAAQAQALATLRSLKQLTVADVERSLASSHVEVSLAALRLASEFVQAAGAETLWSRIETLAEHSDPRVRRAAVESFAQANSKWAERAADALVKRMSIKETDEVVRSAAMGSVHRGNVTYVLPILKRLADSEPSRGSAGEVPPAAVHHVLLTAVRVGDPPTMADALQWGLDTPETMDSALALNALDERAAEEKVVVDKSVLELLRQRIRNALAVLQDDNSSDSDVKAAMSLLGRRAGGFTQSIWRQAAFGSALSQAFSPERRAMAIARWITPAKSAAIQKQAIQAVAATSATNVSTLLLRRLPSASPKIRRDLVQTLMARPDGAVGLLKEVEQARLRADIFDATLRQQLWTHSRSEVRELARRVLQTEGPSRRAEVIATLTSVLDLDSPGDVSAGERVFRKRCASCHKLEDEGHVVGPDLRALTRRDPHWLLAAILDPNREVDARYLSWVAVTDDGESISGLLVEETDEAIILREPGGKQRRLLRKELENFRSTQLSLMPEGLEKDMTPADLRNVIAFVADKTPPPKEFPGNRPRLLRPDAQSIVSLSAAAAEIRGRDIRFERPFGNVGWWHDRGDSVSWKFELAASGEFDVYLNLSCNASAAGNQFQIVGLGQPLQGAVASTGGWDRYRQRKIATVKLPAGPRQVVVRSLGAINEALFDLKEIRLVPGGADPMFETADVSAAPLPRRPPQIAPFLLDETVPIERREQVIHERPGMGPAILTLLVSDLDEASLERQYEKVPWIWRTAIAVGKRNDGGEIRDMLEVSVPGEGEALQDWQAVVIGGGLINGISQLGLSPEHRLNEILAGLPATQRRWPGVLKQAVTMAGDESVKAGTRYDALRMVALLPTESAVGKLRTYLTPAADRQLQMGAVSGLVDVGAPAAESLLLDAASWLKGRNRQLALEGLLRTESGAGQLRKRVVDGRLVLTRDEIAGLEKHSLKIVRQHAAKLHSLLKAP